MRGKADRSIREVSVCLYLEGRSGEGQGVVRGVGAVVAEGESSGGQGTQG